MKLRLLCVVITGISLSPVVLSAETVQQSQTKNSGDSSEVNSKQIEEGPKVVPLHSEIDVKLGRGSQDFRASGFETDSIKLSVGGSIAKSFSNAPIFVAVGTNISHGNYDGNTDINDVTKVEYSITSVNITGKFGLDLGVARPYFGLSYALFGVGKGNVDWYEHSNYRSVNKYSGSFKIKNYESNELSLGSFFDISSTVALSVDVALMASQEFRLSADGESERVMTDDKSFTVGAAYRF